METDEDPFEALRAGRAPELKALRLHNGTVYRWNRGCYGITDGKPHLRIENRILPSGPSILDEVANAAFWFGLISSLVEQYDDIRRVITFEDAAANLQAAGRHGPGRRRARTLRTSTPAAARRLRTADEVFVPSRARRSGQGDRLRAARVDERSSGARPHRVAGRSVVDAIRVVQRTVRVR